MTLQEWKELNPDMVVKPFGNSLCYQIFHRTCDYALWHLSDYFVSSHVSGPSVILCPKTQDESQDNQDTSDLHDNANGLG